MADEWKAVVGGRAIWRGPHLEVVVREFRQDGKALVVFTDEHANPPSGWVSAYQLTEHPDDARHRRLLEAARDLVNCGYDLKTVTRLQSAVQAIDQAESDHAS